MPGLKALYPSTPQDAFDALLAAYDDDNPVLLFEHKGLYRRRKQPVRWNPHYREVWQPRDVLVAGDYATVVTYGEMTLTALEAADYVRSRVRTLPRGLGSPRPFPAAARAQSPTPSGARTRSIVLHEGRTTHGFGAE
jgi:2-oxoisovalerate dehydrogenase E1 component